MASSEQQSTNPSLFVVDSNEHDSRLDRALCRLLGQEKRTLIVRLIRKGNVRLNGKRCKPETHVMAGDTVFLPASLRQDALQDASEQTHAPTPFIPKAIKNLSVLFEDDDILVLDKAAGVVVHGGSGHDAGLVETLKIQLNLPELRLAHRLDRDTSGCLLLAKNLATLRKLSESFRTRDAHKTYFAWVTGHPYPYAGRITSHLLKGQTKSGERMVVDDIDGQEAITDLQTVCLQQAENTPYALVALMPHSGRTHQLRVQLQQQGHAILGDPKYAQRDDIHWYKKIGGKGLALHAWRLRFIHPTTEKTMDLRAPWPNRWAHFTTKD
ncbi:MAG: ribosomal large subunit pseudouridine synthase C [Zetaproteobacteria bacterium CG2_30_46_52]|nr:MAG: ribosomal large subunit pseudouridine synthase C [Zetaproteobacteria bacterium CG2_30_46_52]